MPCRFVWVLPCVQIEKFGQNDEAVKPEAGQNDYKVQASLTGKLGSN